MRSRSHLVRALAVMLPGGALGASFVLALTATQAAAQASPAADDASGPGTNVAERLRAIRVAVEEISSSPGASGSAEPQGEDVARAALTWWGNGGWGRWRWGWPNGWHNWRNGWHNWGNGWHNWGNGWHNYWHNY